MAQEITRTQNGNYVAPDPEDGDTITEEELAAAEAEKNGQAEAEAEKQRLADEAAAAEAAKAKPERPVEQYQGEIARLREERERLRSDRELANREREALREENIKLKARRELEDEAQRKLDEIRTKSTRPDPDVDPYGAELWDLKQWKQAKETEDTERRRLESEQAERTKQQEANAKLYKDADDFLVKDVSKFREENPDGDYPGAANFVSNAFLKLYQGSGYNEQEARVMLANNLYAMAAAAKERGQSAAKSVYDTAVQLGWKSTPKSDDAPAPAATDGKKSAADKIKSLKKAQALSGLGGKDPAERDAADNVMSMTAEEIDALSDDDFLSIQQDPKKGRLLAKRMAELG